ncbi:MAG: TerB family tellurite resistance protein [Candidatus Omnitrophica bacterium]|nr:TerB family tellurite resistance protein [Candidatus Omnitrophota bacterium]
MSGIFAQFRKSVANSVWKSPDERPDLAEIDDKIALGVLLWAVAEADSKFLISEKAKIKEILSSYGKISDKDLPIILNSIETAARERIDLFRFTDEISRDLPYQIKIQIVENLFRVGCADNELDNLELESVRKISSLFGIAHKDFIEAKIKVKKEFGLDTAGF